MSLETWKAEFYPIEASKVSKKDAIDHSLQKWLGLLPENLAKHRCTMLDQMVIDLDGDRYDPPNLYIYSECCALCLLHHTDDATTENEDGDEVLCEACPLYKVRGNVPCDAERSDEGESPWHCFTRIAYGMKLPTYDPKPMIFWLQKAKTEAAE